MKTVAILGGGISGLSTAYYIRKKFGDLVRPIIIERTDRCGGWIKTDYKNNFSYETGPRTVRTAGIVGLNTLDLVEEIGIDKDVMFIPKFHPVSHNRFIFTKGKLVRLPFETPTLFKATPPFERALLFAGLRDIFRIRRADDDDTIYNFIERRFGSDLADYVVDPLIRGVTAGDSKKISVKFLLPQMYFLEQKYGSVVLGWLLNRLLKKEYKGQKSHEIPGWEEIGFSSLATTSLKENWTVWSLEGGLEKLTYRLEEKLVNEMDVKIIKNAPVKSIKFTEERNAITAEVSHCKSDNNQLIETTPCDFVISTIPAWRFSKILRKSKPSHPGLWQVLNMIASTDVLVTNVMYRGRDIIKKENEGFGFLVPSNEIRYTAGLDGLLGVVFDTCAFPQGEDTILTVMSKPTRDMVESGDPAQFIQETVRRYLKITLDIDVEPDDYNINLNMECIPQYIVGHFEKIDAARAFIRAARMPLIISGASYDGVSINECVFSGRRAAEELPF